MKKPSVSWRTSNSIETTMPAAGLDANGAVTNARRSRGRKARAGRTAIAVLMAWSLVGSFAVARGTADPTSSLAPGNVATRWVERALGAVRTGNPAIHTSTPGAGRTYAMVTTAMYDAVNGIDVVHGSSTRGRAVVESYAAAPAGGSREAAASAAAHAVLSSLFGANGPVKDSLDDAHDDEVAALGSDPAVEEGRSWGAAVGAEVLSIRSTDGTQEGGSKQGGSGPGAFPRIFSATQFRDMTPFGVTSVTPFLSSGPPALTSEEYAEAFNEVKALGSFADGDPERAAIARHWLAEGGTVRETGLWFKIALNVVAERGTAASLQDTTRLFALLGMGIADSVVTAWAEKFNHHYWRPGDAIRQASTDGNPATEADPNWNPRGGICTAANVAQCPVFGGTPEHTSGTSTFAGSASTILAALYCTDHISFSFAGEQTGSPMRSYAGFKDAAREAGRSRIYGGIHFQFSNDAGREAGKEIGREIVGTRLLEATASTSDCVR